MKNFTTTMLIAAIGIIVSIVVISLVTGIVNNVSNVLP